MGTCRFASKTAIVTGAAGGIGRATALRLAGEGSCVLAVDIKQDELAETIDLSGGPEVVPIIADLTDRDAPATIVDKALAQFGGMDILINNAGISGRNRSGGDVDDQQWDAVVDMNASSVYRMARAALPHLPRPGGKIVNISSVFGLVGFPGSPAYAAAKGAVAQLTRQMASDYATDGININAIAPGVIETAMTRDSINNDPWYHDAMIKNAPMGIGQPDDVAGVIAFLCSDDARYVNGQVIAVDGGWSTTRYWPKP
ncbi:MAG: SDR family oxidoreductase [Pseudomonadota bacterium]